MATSPLTTSNHSRSAFSRIQNIITQVDVPLCEIPFGSGTRRSNDWNGGIHQVNNLINSISPSFFRFFLHLIRNRAILTSSFSFVFFVLSNFFVFFFLRRRELKQTGNKGK